MTIYLQDMTCIAFNAGRLRSAEIAAFIQVYKNDVLVISGRISQRTLGEIINIQAITGRFC